jgi:hypothetical protein
MGAWESLLGIAEGPPKLKTAASSRLFLSQEQRTGRGRERNAQILRSTHGSKLYSFLIATLARSQLIDASVLFSPVPFAFHGPGKVSLQPREGLAKWGRGQFSWRLPTAGHSGQLALEQPQWGPRIRHLQHPKCGSSVNNPRHHRNKAQDILAVRDDISLQLYVWRNWLENPADPVPGAIRTTEPETRTRTVSGRVQERVERVEPRHQRCAGADSSWGTCRA